MTMTFHAPFLRVALPGKDPRTYGVCDTCAEVEEVASMAAQRRFARDPVCRSCEDARPHHIARRDAYGARVD